ncbi:MAG: histidinol dehydrogenase [Chloroflexota bacterium]|nr:histidinol dehydrogenase [Chloroflexota bacterium]
MTATTPSTTATLRLQRLDLASVVAGDPDAVSHRRALVRRGSVPDPSVREAARQVLADVRLRGDEAVREANDRVGGGRPDGRLVIGRAELARARGALRPGVRRALDQSIANVERFARDQLPRTTHTEITPGIDIERRWAPIASVGAYVPGGSAPYPSSLVMTVVPARVAGVERIVVASPADRSGNLDPVLCGAAGLLEVEALIVAGGAQAVGSLAYGLPDAGIEPVDRIVGPGNAWVTAAKIEVSGEVAIDLPAGPSEGLVLADPPADPRRVALDLITQAEHGPDSPVLLVTTNGAFADAVELEIRALLVEAHRRDILLRSLAEHGRVVLAPDLDAAIAFANDYAPEHLSVDVQPLEETVERLRHAGSLFVGPWAPESAGDYATGANHVLPTGGLARSSGGLAVETYGKYTQVQRITREGLAGIREAVTTLAEVEGLLAHRDAVARRFDPERSRDR